MEEPILTAHKRPGTSLQIRAIQTLILDNISVNEFAAQGNNKAIPDISQ